MVGGIGSFRWGGRRVARFGGHAMLPLQL
jgi:hypothetical protein